MKNNTSFYSYAFGCRVNEAEKEEIDKKMLKNGFIFNEKDPDVYIINTCAVTHKAEREARQLIYQIKKKLPKTKIVITGCSATYWQKNQLYKDLPVDLLIENVNKEFLVEILKKRLISKKNNNSQLTIKNTITSKFLSSNRVMIKIQDGCQRYCTFCIVPYLRGFPKSIKINEILTIVKNYSEKIKEVVLTAINTEAFGYDTSEKFVDLIKTILEKTTISRLSFGSIHPWSINEDFFNFYEKYHDSNRLVHFFHIPLQSGSDKILTLMKRGYKTFDMLNKLNEIKKINPLSFIGTDVIVGFLEENDKDFQDTYDFLEKAPIDKFHVFRFSKRTKTQAYFMAKKLKEPDEKTKEKRSKLLIDLGKRKYRLFLEKNLGRFSKTLILNKKVNNYYQGLLDNQLPILIPIKKNIIPGEIYMVKVKDLKKDFLFGSLVD